MVIVHNPRKCSNCGSCVAIYPELFEFRNDQVTLIDGEIEQNTGIFQREINNVESVEDVTKTCPVSAIEIK